MSIKYQQTSAMKKGRCFWSILIFRKGLAADCTQITVYVVLNIPVNLSDPYSRRSLAIIFRVKKQEVQGNDYFELKILVNEKNKLTYDTNFKFIVHLLFKSFKQFLNFNLSGEYSFWAIYHNFIEI